jgi:cytochrome b
LKHAPVPLATSDVEEKPIRVWDVPTRLVHWSTALLLGVSWLTAENGWIAWHKASGYAALCLVLFRLYWGVRGSDTARFAQFVRGPRAVRAYLIRILARTGRGLSVGHNPLGGWSVMLMLVLLTLQAGSGLFAVDEYGIEGGRLAQHLSFEASRRAAAFHRVLFDILLAAIAVHVSAVIAYLALGRENLVGPMITGRKRLRGGLTPQPTMASLRGATVAFVAVAAAVLALAFYG